jgi:hypothetical protein
MLALRHGGGADEIVCFASRLGLTVTVVSMGIEQRVLTAHHGYQLCAANSKRAGNAASSQATDGARSFISAANSDAGVMRRDGSR